MHHGTAAVGHQRASEQPKVLLRDKTSMGMFEVMRKQPTFAERDMDVGHGSRSLKVKISIYRIVTENLFL